MDIDHAGNQPLAVKVVAFGEVTAGDDFGDAVARDYQGAFDGFGGQHDPGIGEDGLIHRI